MAERIDIKDDELQSLNDKVIVLTGGSSGIGLATTKLLLSLGAKVVTGDINPPPDDVASKVTFSKTDVTSWDDQKALFDAAIKAHGKVDHAFANAGVPPVTNFLEDDLDDKGELLPPNTKVIQINLIGVIYTAKLAIHYIRKTQGKGSVVLTGSASSFQQMMIPDYTCAKTGVLGLMRGMMHLMNNADLPIRMNVLGPQWVQTNIVPTDAFKLIGEAAQTPDFIARQVAYLMADETRHGQFLFSDCYVVKEIERPTQELIDGFLERKAPGWAGLNETLALWTAGNNVELTSKE